MAQGEDAAVGKASLNSKAQAPYRKRPHKEAPSAAAIAGDAGPGVPTARWIKGRLEGLFEAAYGRPLQFSMGEEQISQQRLLIEQLGKVLEEQKRELKEQETELEEREGIAEGDLKLSELELESSSPWTCQVARQDCYLILLREKKGNWPWVMDIFTRGWWPTAPRVHHILRIKNQSLTDAFDASHPPGGEEPQWMFISTPRENVFSICNAGFGGGAADFRWFTEKASAFEKVPYFEKASTKDGKLYMFLAKVYSKAYDWGKGLSVVDNLDSLPVYLIEFSILCPGSAADFHWPSCQC